MIVHKVDSFTDKVWPYVDNGVFLDGRLKTLSIIRFEHRTGPQLTNTTEAHNLFIRYCQTGRHPDQVKN